MRRNSTRFIQVSQPKWAKYYAKGFRHVIPGSPPDSLGLFYQWGHRWCLLLLLLLWANASQNSLREKGFILVQGMRRHSVHFESMVRGLVGEACDWDPNTYSRRHGVDRKWSGSLLTGGCGFWLHREGWLQNQLLNPSGFDKWGCFPHMEILWWVGWKHNTYPRTQFWLSQPSPRSSMQREHRGLIWEISMVRV